MMEQYEKVRCIGYGSKGHVILVKKTNSKTMYAIKISNVSDSINSEKKSMVCETSILQEINHANIVSIKNTFIENGFHHIVLEYVPLGNIHQFLSYFQESKQVIPECIIKHILYDCLKGLAAVHTHHIVHRDIKPENFLIDKDGVIKICDFTASIKQDERVHQTCVGTIQYMSPEVLKRDPVTCAADIWSLGCVVYELMCRRPLFPKCSLDTMMVTVLEQWDRIVSLPALYSNEIREIIKEMIIINPFERPSADSLLQRSFFSSDTGRELTKAYAERTLIHSELKYALQAIPYKVGSSLSDRLPFDSDSLIKNGNSLISIYKELAK